MPHVSLLLRDMGVGSLEAARARFALVPQRTLKNASLSRQGFPQPPCDGCPSAQNYKCAIIAEAMTVRRDLKKAAKLLIAKILISKFFDI